MSDSKSNSFERIGARTYFLVHIALHVSIVLLAVMLLSMFVFKNFTHRSIWGEVLIPGGTALVYLLPGYFISRHIRRGHRLFRKGKYKNALQAFERSLVYFEKHRRLDRFRILIPFSTFMSFREMALLNIAASLTQLGNKDECQAAYQRVLDEFPDSQHAKLALKMIDTFSENKEADGQ